MAINILLILISIINLVFTQYSEKQLKANACSKLIRARFQQDKVN